MSSWRVSAPVTKTARRSPSTKSEGPDSWYQVRAVSPLRAPNCSVVSWYESFSRAAAASSRSRGAPGVDPVRTGLLHREPAQPARGELGHDRPAQPRRDPDVDRVGGEPAEGAGVVVHRRDGLELEPVGRQVRDERRVAGGLGRGRRRAGVDVGVLGHRLRRRPGRHVDAVGRAGRRRRRPVHLRREGHVAVAVPGDDARLLVHDEGRSPCRSASWRRATPRARPA